MYWLLEYEEQERMREQMIALQTSIGTTQTRDQSEQVFPYIGRKSRSIAKTIIEHLSSEGDTIADPFGGSGTFAYAALDCRRHVKYNEWEPYAYKMSTSPFFARISDQQYLLCIQFIKDSVSQRMFELYRTKCPQCGRELMFDGLF